MPSPTEHDAAHALMAAGVALRAGKSGKFRAATVAAEADFESIEWSLFSALEHLARFEAPETAITDQQLAIVAALPAIAQIDLTGAANITDASREVLEAVPKLQLLKVTGTSLAPDTIRAMRKNMIQTRIVYH